MKKSIKELFAALEGGASDEKKPGGKTAEDGGGNQKAEVSPAERIGRALLDRLGESTGMDEEALADAITAVWAESDKLPAEGKREYEEPEAEIVRPAKPPLVAEQRRVRAPMRAEAAAESPMDYSELSQEQFRKLKKQLQKAAADGRRVRI